MAKPLSRIECTVILSDDLEQIERNAEYLAGENIKLRAEVKAEAARVLAHEEAWRSDRRRINELERALEDARGECARLRNLALQLRRPHPFYEPIGS